jgi:protein involved in polysaccharide export with SLBB domain
MKIFLRIGCAGLLLSCLTVAQAQINPSSLFPAISEKTTTTNYFFARPNDITIVVNLVGFIQKPGRYEIASSIDLVELISLAGGPTAEGSLSKVRLIRIIKDAKRGARQDLQSDQKTRSVFLTERTKLLCQQFDLDLEDLPTLQPEDLQLMPGDIVSVDRTGWSTVKDVFGVIVPAAIITTAVAEVIIATKR